MNNHSLVALSPERERERESASESSIRVFVCLSEEMHFSLSLRPSSLFLSLFHSLLPSLYPFVLSSRGFCCSRSAFQRRCSSSASRCTPCASSFSFLIVHGGKERRRKRDRPPPRRYSRFFRTGVLPFSHGANILLRTGEMRREEEEAERSGGAQLLFFAYRNPVTFDSPARVNYLFLLFRFFFSSLARSPDVFTSLGGMKILEFPM